MTKQELKEFVKNHKKEIILGAGVALIGGAIFVVTKKQPKSKFVKDNEAVRLYLEMLNVIDDAKSGSEMYIQMVPKDFKEICGRDELIVRDSKGDFLNITGGVLFGNMIEE